MTRFIGFNFKFWQKIFMSTGKFFSGIFLLAAVDFRRAKKVASWRGLSACWRNVARFKAVKIGLWYKLSSTGWFVRYTGAQARKKAYLTLCTGEISTRQQGKFFREFFWQIFSAYRGLSRGYFRAEFLYNIYTLTDIRRIKCTSTQRYKICAV